MAPTVFFHGDRPTTASRLREHSMSQNRLSENIKSFDEETDMRRRNLTKLQMQRLAGAYTDYLPNCNTHMWIAK